MLRTLFGTEALESKCVGYCWYHKKWVTVQQLKQKECLRKQCNRFEKKEHPYWEEREKKKQMKKERKRHVNDKSVQNSISGERNITG